MLYNANYVVFHAINIVHKSASFKVIQGHSRTK